MVMSDKMKTARGRARAAHFANGGDVRAWRGRKQVIQSKKKVQNKKACRQRIDW